MESPFDKEYRCEIARLFYPAASPSSIRRFTSKGAENHEARIEIRKEKGKTGD
jgi:hypothetical protein